MKNFSTLNHKFLNGLLIDGDDMGGSSTQVQVNPEAKPAPKQEVRQETTGNGLLIDPTPSKTGQRELGDPNPSAICNGLLIDPTPKDSTEVAVATPSSASNTSVVSATGSTAVSTQVNPQASTTPDGDVDASELGYGAFPKLIISNGEFNLDDTPAGKSILVGVQFIQTQFLISPDGVQDADKDQLAYYVKGRTTTTKGVSIEDFKAKLRADGFEPKESEYLMVQAVVLKFSNAVGDVLPVGSPVIMQIPGASLQRFKGIMVMLQNADYVDAEGNKTRGVPLTERCVMVGVGAATKSGGGKTYNPWTFEAKGLTSKVCEKFGINLSGMGAEPSDDLMDF